MGFRGEGQKASPYRSPPRPLTKREVEYLSPHLPPEYRAPGTPGRERELERLRWKAVRTNRVYASLVLGWLTLGVVGVYFLSFAVESTWAADHVARSGRGPMARVFCYLELYPPTSLLLVWVMMVVGMLTLVEPPPGGWPWARVLGVLVCWAAFVVLAHVGVVRRWHPLRRLGIYAGLAVLAVLWVWMT
jgi:hypothetical protein